jgi:aryl-alcohol dehydrogenase-like predicted oxidoreductase
MVESKKIPTEYRYLGNTGLKVSVFSFGNWLNSDNKDDYEITRDAMKLCKEAGINFYDTAELYGNGIAETLMGRAIKGNSGFHQDLEGRGRCERLLSLPQAHH